MKKKIALFLAAVMVMGPISVFARSENELVNQPSNVADNTVIFEDGSYSVGQFHELFPSGQGDASNNEKFESVVNGPTLEIDVTSGTSRYGNIFKADLENASYFFRNTMNVSFDDMGTEDWITVFAGIVMEYGALRNVEIASGAIVSIDGKTDATETLEASDFQAINNDLFSDEEIRYFASMLDLESMTADTFVGVAYDDDSSFNAAANSAVLALVNVSLAGTDVDYPISNADLSGEGYDRFTDPDSTDYTVSEGNVALEDLADDFKDGTDFATYDLTKGIYVPSLDTYYRFAGPDSADPGALVYSMLIEGSDENLGLVTLLGVSSTGAVDDYDSDADTVDNLFDPAVLDFEGDNKLEVPVVARVTEEGEVRISVAGNGNYTAITNQNLQIATVSGSRTDTSITEEIVSKYSFTLNDLEIDEVRTGSIRQGYIEFQAPDGFYFSDPRKPAYVNEDDATEYITFTAEGTLRFAGNRSELSNSSSTFYATWGVDDDGEEDRTKLRINTTGVTSSGSDDEFAQTAAGLGIIPTSQTQGRLVITNAVLIADDYAEYGDVILTVKGTGITEEDFKIGERKDYGIELKTISTVTKLVNGRLNDAYVNRGLDNDTPAGYVTSASGFDKDHKTADVSFSENVTASWWALRESEFTLPAGVKFMQVEIDEEDNLDHTHNNYKLDGEYPLSNTKVNYVHLNANRLRVTDVEIQRDETAYFEMSTWVSVESGWEGDIMLGITGNDLLDEVAPVKIATAVSPITVKASVTDVKIGYQWQKVADVTVTETEKGMLQRDKEVVLSLDDEITGSDRIAFAPDFVTEINTDSNMTISKPSVEEGILKFEIERASNNKPASIKFSNMYVKIDRTVPESNKQPYKVVVGGNAVAANYYRNVEDVTTVKSIHPLFSVKGIGADYLNVVTSATNSSSLFSNVVRVTIGSNEVIIGRDGASQTLQMDTAAYISTTNSTMVPVRFVSQAFGLSDEAILWDPEARTVTILGGPNGTVQFKIGSDQITIGGATTTMYSPDEPPIKVSAEIMDNRSFLPFRQLGNALGVPVEWDEATNTAIYNAQLLETEATTTTADDTTAAE